MITPRGYGNKYDITTREVREGQRPLRSLVLDEGGAPVGGAAREKTNEVYMGADEAQPDGSMPPPVSR